MPYVYTNPDTITRLYSEDMVFVLALRDPNETLLKRKPDSRRTSVDM
jgi:hypothetical protein